jgi:hypothetical protein
MGNDCTIKTMTGKDLKIVDQEVIKRVGRYKRKIVKLENGKCFLIDHNINHWSTQFYHKIEPDYFSFEKKKNRYMQCLKRRLEGFFFIEQEFNWDIEDGKKALINFLERKNIPKEFLAKILEEVESLNSVEEFRQKFEDKRRP